MKTLRSKNVIPLCAALAFAPIALAEDAPLSYKASPDVYKLLAENSQFRVILATWKPGQRDAQHSHSPVASYRLTDCKARLLDPTGKVIREGEGKAGTAVLQDAIVSHALENVGDGVCQILLVERK